MSPRISPPKIDARKASDLLRQLRGMAPHYTKEWPAKDDADPGVALLKVFSFIAEGVVGRLNRAPERNFLAFLDMLGVRLLPATPARAPVRFLVAKGTEDSFTVPEGTQVSAGATPTRPQELPFETIDNLQVIPAALSAMFAVDPERDHIYRSPPGFLELATAAAELPALTVTAFSSAGSKFLQLDPPDQVAQGDFLRIEQTLSADAAARGCVPATHAEQSRAIDHLVVSAVKGPIVTVRDPLPRDYAEGTRVQKVTRFELFEGKNWQEHVLFLGHNDYFAIKSEAEITLLVEHAPGASANLPVFKVVWEFFGVTETDKTEGWHEFKVELDATRGFSRDGEVVLIKPAGEIKEKEINGSTSRWIRARLDEPLPATPPTPLPKIESITLKVSSGGKDLAADQAFHNDTPLTTGVEFYPFGTEPRIFDRFSVASEEAFSKHGAEVTLDFLLHAADLLAAPAGIVNNGLLRVFAHAAAGRLLEFQIDPGEPDPVIKKHGTPPDTRIEAESIPTVVDNADNGNQIGVFVKSEDGKIYLRLIVGEVEAGWHWFNLQAPIGELKFNPSAVRVSSTGMWHVFVVVNKQLFSKTFNPLNNIQTDWTPHLSGGQDPQIDSSPFAVDLGNAAAAFVTDINGVTWGWDGLTWTLHTPLVLTEPDPAYVAAANARPFVRRYSNGTNEFRIFLRSQSNQLVLIDTKGGDKNYGAPGNTLVASNPFVVGTAFNFRAYVRAADDSLWSLSDSGVGNPTWTPHLSPSGFKLMSDPFALAYGNGLDSVSVFSTSDKNTLLEFRASEDDGGGGDITGTLRAGPLDIIVLQDDLDTENYYLHITDGPGKDAVGDTIRRFNKALTRDDFAVLDKPLSESPTTDTTYNLLLEEGNGGEVQNATATTVELEAGTVANLPVPGLGDDFKYYVLIKSQSLLIKDQIRKITLPGNGDEVTIDGQWANTPVAGDTYQILRLDTDNEDRKAAAASARRAVLDAGASNDDDKYNGKFLEITSGAAQSSTSLRINDYFSATKSVVLEQDFAAPPAAGSDYLITTIAQVWLAYPDPSQTELRPELSWEYWNGKGWLHLPVKDFTNNFLVPAKVIFTVPENIAKTEVAGQENYWIRARIVGGDYGRELFTVDPVTGRIKIEKDPIRPPLVKQLTISYKLTELKPPQFCVTFNNLSFLDQTAANVTPDKHFRPYFPLPDAGKAVYFGFDREFDGGPVRIYFAAKELEVDERNRPKLDWQFAFGNGWSDILADDDTNAFTKPELVSLIVPEGFQNRLQFGRALFWLRATLTRGSWTASPLLAGAFINTVEAIQARTVLDEILGSSTGEKNQRFRFQLPVIEGEENQQSRFRLLPVLEGEEVRVREVLTDQEREQLVAERGEDAVLTIHDQQGLVLETWIRWTEVLEFFNSEPGSRHYRLDRATGEIEFGDGLRGRIPPAGGDNIRAFAYQTGGGAAGNVGPGEITSAVTAVAGVDSVINPVAGGGGSEAATNEEMMVIGPEQVSNRGRAVTPDDFEQLAREASREVRKALCLPNRNAAGRHESGWASVYIVPDSKDAAPVPSLELRRAVERYLAARADVTLTDQGHIFVGPPEYVPVSVDVTVFARSLDLVAAAEQSVRRRLDQFLHPLTGGPAGEGWDFGRDLAASDLYALLEDIDEVDHVGPLRLAFGGRESEERVEVGASALIASGTHKITMNVGAGE